MCGVDEVRHCMNGTCGGNCRFCEDKTQKESPTPDTPAATPVVWDKCNICFIPLFIMGATDRQGRSFAHPACYEKQRADMAERRLADLRLAVANVVDRLRELL